MPKGYIKSQTSVHFMHYHFVWCPKYRRPILKDKIAKRHREQIAEQKHRHKMQIYDVRHQGRIMAMQSYNSRRVYYVSYGLRSLTRSRMCGRTAIGRGGGYRPFPSY